ncbi:MAG: hypothetical protein MJZ16_02460 [Bacteroidales bacterium]|nr:hypothetical protein [Bacteroidales bacterium]
MSRRGKLIYKVATIIVVVAILFTAIYIMANRIGLVEGLDFGAGAYYYADIPNFEKILRMDTYSSGLPLWLAIVLFLAWGYLMYKLWVWIDSRK